MYDADPALRDSLSARIESYFRATQLLAHREFKLGRLMMIRDEPGMRSIRTTGLLGVKLTVEQGVLGVQSTDASGNVVVDTRRDHLEEKRRFRELVAKHASDETLQVMLRAYEAAVGDEADEFVHLYEIRDALKRRFGSEKQALKQLGSPIDASWDVLGRLANYEPVLQGRHRGGKGPNLREATGQELTAARDAGRDLIKAYIAFLTARRKAHRTTSNAGLL